MIGLRKLRLERGLTLAQLAGRSGMHSVSISKYESGTMKIENITLRNALALAKALQCRPEDLM